MAMNNSTANQAISISSVSFEQFLATRHESLIMDSKIDSLPMRVVELGGLTPGDFEKAGGETSSISSAIAIGVSDTPLPDHPLVAESMKIFDVVLAPWAPSRAFAGSRADLEQITKNVMLAPVAALTFAQLLRANHFENIEVGLLAESHAYSALLASSEFKQWLRTKTKIQSANSNDPVQIERVENSLTITLNRPQVRNALNSQMRDQLLEALMIPELDDTVTKVIINGAGEGFCSGGDLSEFGTADDPAISGLIRTAASVARKIDHLRDKISVNVHGACIGAGLELASFAGSVLASPDAFFRLPELTLGLIPGSGGTVSVPRRIGRWRTAWLVLSAENLTAQTALQWGLIDEIC